MGSPLLLGAALMLDIVDLFVARILGGESGCGIVFLPGSIPSARAVSTGRGRRRFSSLRMVERHDSNFSGGNGAFFRPTL